MGPNASSVRNPAAEQRRAANAYLIWPLAAANIVREGNEATIWARLHARQALVYGVFASLTFAIVLSVPLVAVIAVPAISIGATIAVYGFGLLADAVVAVAALVVALRYAARAARGELFAIPLVSAVVDTLFRVERR